MGKKNKADKSEESDKVEEKPTSSSSAVTFGAQKDPAWWDITTFSKVSSMCSIDNVLEFIFVGG